MTDHHHLDREKDNPAARAADALWMADKPMHLGDLGYYRHGFEDGAAWAANKKPGWDGMPAAWLIVNAPDHVIRYVAEMANAETARHLLGGELPPEPERPVKRSHEPRAAEATRDPIWLVEAREIRLRPDSSWEWCCECEAYYKRQHGTCKSDHGGTAASPSEAQAADPEGFWVYYRGSGHAFLDRDVAEGWARRREHHYPEGSRVFCYALPKESRLKEVLDDDATRPEPETLDVEEASASTARQREILGGETVAELVNAGRLTMREVEVMRHCLGADHHSSPGFRNYYNADQGDEVLLELERKGMVLRGREGKTDAYFRVAPIWAELILGKAKADELKADR